MSSKGEKQIYNLLSKDIPLLESQYVLKYDNVHHYAYDIKYKNKIIEYNGDFWHANPSKYKPNDIINFPNSHGTVSAKEVWSNDSKKNQFCKVSRL